VRNEELQHPPAMILFEPEGGSQIPTAFVKAGSNKSLVVPGPKRTNTDHDILSHLQSDPKKWDQVHDRSKTVRHEA
jgi:hypothetical protein